MSNLVYQSVYCFCNCVTLMEIGPIYSESVVMLSYGGWMVRLTSIFLTVCGLPSLDF